MFCCGILAAFFAAEPSGPVPPDRPWYEQAIRRGVTADRPTPSLNSDAVAAVGQQRAEANRLAADLAARRRDRDAADRAARAADRDALAHSRQEAAADRAAAEQRAAAVRTQAERGAAELAGQMAAARQTVAEAEGVSAARFARGNDEFKQFLADRMAEIKAAQDRTREMAKQAVMAYFTGGASLAMSAEAIPKSPSTGPSLKKSSTAVASRPTPNSPTSPMSSPGTPGDGSKGVKVYDAPVGPQPLQATNVGRNEKWVGKLGGYVGSAVGGVLGAKAGKGTTGQIASGVGGGVGSDVGQYVGEAVGRFLDRHADRLRKEYDPKSDPRFDPLSLFDR